MIHPTEKEVVREMDHLKQLYADADFDVQFAIYPNPKDRTKIRTVPIPIRELIDSPYLRVMAVDSLMGDGDRNRKCST